MTFPFPVMAPISSNILVWIPFPEIFHLVRSPNWQSAITGTVGRDSFRTHFRYWASSVMVAVAAADAAAEVTAATAVSAVTEAAAVTKGAGATEGAVATAG